MDVNPASNIPPLLIAVTGQHDVISTPAQRSSKTLQHLRDEDILEYSCHQQHREGSLQPEASPILPHTSNRTIHGASVKSSTHAGCSRGDDAESRIMRHSKTDPPPANLIGIGPESPTLISSPTGVLAISTGLSPVKNPRSEFSESSSPSPSSYLSPTFKCYTPPTIAPMHAGTAEPSPTGDLSSQRIDNSGQYSVHPFHAWKMKTTVPVDSEDMELFSSVAAGFGGGSREIKSLSNEQQTHEDLGSGKADLFNRKHGHPTLPQRSITSFNPMTPPSDSSSSTVGGVSQLDFANVLPRRSPVAAGSDALTLTSPQVHRDSDNGLPEDALRYNEGRLFSGGSSSNAFSTTVVGPNPSRGVYYPGGSYNSDMGTDTGISDYRNIICFGSSAGDDVSAPGIGDRSASCDEVKRDSGEEILRMRGKAIPVVRRSLAADESGRQNIVLRTACNECTLRKVRCDGEKPCLACRRKGVACTFSASQKQGRHARMPKNDRLLEVRPVGGSASKISGHRGPVVDAGESTPPRQANETRSSSSPAPLAHLHHGFSIAAYRDASRGEWTNASRWATASSSPSSTSPCSVTGRLGSGSRGRGFRGGTRGRARGGAAIIRSRSTASASAGSVAAVGVSKRGVGRGRGGSGSRGRGRAGDGVKRYRLSDEGHSIAVRPFRHGHRLPRRAQASQRQVLMAAAGLFESDDNDNDGDGDGDNGDGDGDEKGKDKRQDMGQGEGDRAEKVGAVDSGNVSENDIPAAALVRTTTKGRGGDARVNRDEIRDKIRDGIGEGIRDGITGGIRDGIENKIGVGVASRIGNGMKGYGGTGSRGEGGAVAEADGGDISDSDSHKDNGSDSHSHSDDDDDMDEDDEMEDAESSSGGEGSGSSSRNNGNEGLERKRKGDRATGRGGGGSRADCTNLNTDMEEEKGGGVGVGEGQETDGSEGDWGATRDGGPLSDDEDNDDDVECDGSGGSSFCVIDARALPKPSRKKEGKQVWSQLRKACDRCTSKKVKCDGKEGCFQCKRVGAVCHFSICRRSGPRRVDWNTRYTPYADSKGQKKIGAAGPIIPRDGYEKVTVKTGACRTSSPCPYSFADGKSKTEHYHCRSPLCEYASKTMEKLMEHKRTHHPESAWTDTALRKVSTTRKERNGVVSDDACSWRSNLFVLP